MTEARSAKMAYLTQPGPGVILLNIQDGDKFERFELTQRQLANIIVDGAAIALRAAETVA